MTTELDKPTYEELEQDLARERRVNRSMQATLRNTQQRLTDLLEGSPVKPKVETVFARWIAATWNGKGRRPVLDTGPGSRTELISRQIAQFELDDLLTAIDVLGEYPHAGPRGRSKTPYPGSKRYAEVKHAIGNAERIKGLLDLRREAERRTFNVIAEDVKATLDRTEGYRPDDWEEQAA